MTAVATIHCQRAYQCEVANMFFAILVGSVLITLLILKMEGKSQFMELLLASKNTSDPAYVHIHTIGSLSILS
jgi:hypothetical protein